MKNYNIDESKGMEIGLYSLGDLLPDAHTGNKISEQERIKNIVHMTRLAEEAGLDVFSLGESHQKYFISQAHQVILGYIAAVTSKIKISSGVTVLSTADPVRVFEEFSTLDLLSDGRIELIPGRASRTGVYKLMGISLKDYEAIFEEKFNLMLQLNRERVVNWEGKYRPALENAEILPHPLNNRLIIWRGVGGSPASAIKAGFQGVPMTLATLAGPASAFKQSVDAYRLALDQNGYDASEFPVATTSLCYIADDTSTAMREYFPYMSSGFEYVNGRPFSKYLFAEAKNSKNTLMVGNWELIVEKILYQHELYGHQRFLAQVDFGGLPFSKIEKIIDILANRVAPAVRKETKKD
jgi:alkanesulfonate monooxygenase SsuD/methylene tetrahydromethanopterin reductase-like flavin-dependent oxidoreductase (luciferase family)